MLYRASKLKGQAIAAVDGDIGSVEDLYFDDERWGIRYFVVNTGGWLDQRLVLISPLAILPGDWPEQRVPVRFTREQVKNSPSVDTDQPVSRHYEKAHADYYGHSYYWAGPQLWGIGGYSSMLDAQPVPPDPRDCASVERAAAELEAAENSHLRSCTEVAGYRIEATDGSIGHIDDFLIDTDTWGIVHLIVDQRNWLPGAKVVVPPGAVEHVDWKTGSVRLGMTRDEIGNCPEYG